MHQFVKISQKMQKLIEEAWPNWKSSWFLDHKCITLSIINIWKWLLFLWFLIIIHNKFYSHGKSNCARKIVKIKRGFQATLVLYELGFWTSKDYILFIFWNFLSDSKFLLLFKGLSTNYFKSFKKIWRGRCLMMKKYYMSSR